MNSICRSKASIITSNKSSSMGPPQSRNTKYMTSNHDYTMHDVSDAFSMAIERKHKGKEFKESHFSFGFLGKSPPKTSAEIKRKYPVQNAKQQRNVWNKGFHVSQNFYPLE